MTNRANKIRTAKRSAIVTLSLSLLAASLVAPGVAQARTPAPARGPVTDSRGRTPNSMPDPVEGICAVFRYGSTQAASPDARSKAAAMMPMCNADKQNSAKFWTMVDSAYSGGGTAHWGTNDVTAMQTMMSEAKTMGTSMKSHMQDLELVLRSSTKAAVQQLARAAKAAKSGRKFTEKRMSYPAAGFCRALDAAALAPQTNFRMRKYKKLEIQRAECRGAKASFAKLWKQVSKTGKQNRNNSYVNTDALLTSRSIWDDIADAFSSFFKSFLSVLSDVLTLGGLLATDPGTLSEPAYTAFVKARDKVLAGMDFFTDAADQAANAAVPIEVDWSGRDKIQIMKSGTSSYTGEPVSTHPKIPLNYLTASGGTPPYKFANVDADSSIAVSEDGVIGGWLTGFSNGTLDKSPGFALGTNIRVTDANGVQKVARVKQDYIYAPDWHMKRECCRREYIGAIGQGYWTTDFDAGRIYDGCPYNCVGTGTAARNPFPLTPPYEVGPNAQWAVSATATSSFKTNQGDPFSPSQATGAPTGTACVDYSKSWTSKSRNKLDSITLKYQRAVVPSMVRVYEQYNPGAITSVTVSGSGQSAVVYRAEAATRNWRCPSSLRVPVSRGGQFPVNFAVDTVTVTVDQRVRGKRDQIDAVQLIGS